MIDYLTWFCSRIAPRLVAIVCGNHTIICRNRTKFVSPNFFVSSCVAGLFFFVWVCHVRICNHEMYKINANALLLEAKIITTTHLRTFAGQQLDLIVGQRRQTLQKLILLETRLVRHRRIRSHQQERHRYREPSHIHRILSSRHPAIIESRQLAGPHDRTAHPELGHQPDRPHRNLARVPHLLEYRQIVRVVIVGEIKHPLGGVRPNPRKSSVAIRNAARFRFVLLETLRHRCDQMDERHADVLQLAGHQLRWLGGILDDQPEQVRHMLEGVTESRDFGHLFGTSVRRCDDVQRRWQRLFRGTRNNGIDYLLFALGRLNYNACEISNGG